MSDDKPDTTTMSGAEFQRHAGTDPVKWAEAMLHAHAESPVVGMIPDPTDAECLSFFATWLRDYAEVRVAEEVGRVTARLVPRHDD